MSERLTEAQVVEYEAAARKTLKALKRADEVARSCGLPRVPPSKSATSILALVAEVAILRSERDAAVLDSHDDNASKRHALKERDTAIRLVSRLRSRLARVCAYAERASFADCVKRERRPTTNEIAPGTRFSRGGSVWSRRVPGGRRNER